VTVRRADTPEARRYWAGVGFTSREVESWPAWRSGKAPHPRVLAAPGSGAEADILRRAGVCPNCRGALPALEAPPRLCWECWHLRCVADDVACRDARCPEHGRDAPTPAVEADPTAPPPVGPERDANPTSSLTQTTPTNGSDDR
jgi:hypothetical protein